MANKTLINHRIPSTMSLAGLEYLGKMARLVPENGTIVEIGPLFGSSTWVLAKNAKPSVKVYSIDTWEPAPWIDKIEKRYRKCIPFSKEAFLEYTKDCPNVTAIQGWSPDVVSDWDCPIDMFFDDATHGDPGFSANLNFFLPFIRETGIICGDDYSSGWPDIVRVVDDLGKGWSKQPEVIGRVWSLTRSEQNTPKFVADMQEHTSLPTIKVSTVDVGNTVYKLPAGTWSGSLHKPFALKKIELSLESADNNLGLEWSLQLSNGQKVEDLKSGESYEAPGKRRIIGISAQLVGSSARKYKLEYQVGFCWGEGEGQRYPLSAAVSAGGELISENPKIAINALRFSIIERKGLFAARVKYYADKVRSQKWPG